MSSKTAPESSLTSVALIFFAHMFAIVALVGANVLPPYFAHGSGLLTLSLVALIGPLVYALISMSSLPRRDGWLNAVLVLTIALVVGGLLSRQLALRGFQHAPEGIHDGAVQTEVAATFLLAGKNPYGADYRGTAYETLNPPIVGGPSDNVVWHHYIYPPATILMQAAITGIARPLGAYPDARWLGVIAVLVFTVVLVRAAASSEARRRALLLSAGNPLLILFMLIGANDALMSVALIVSIMCVSRRPVLSGIAFALALGLKQSAWISIPCLFIWLVILYRRASLSLPALRRWLWSAAVTTALIFGPFAVWNLRSFWTDVVVYGSGSIPYSYPISGTTVLQYLHVWRIIPSPWSIVPTYPLQSAVLLLLFWYSWAVLRRSPTISRLLTCLALTLLSVLLVSRYNNPNYLVTIAMLYISAYVYDRPTSSAQE